MWLIDLVENLLSITRIEDDKLGLKTQPELLEEIFQEALQHLDRNASQHQDVYKRQALPPCRGTRLSISFCFPACKAQFSRKEQAA